ncbi:hypothetical protein ACQ4PT_064798 [Festuca glaucescens]
MGKYMRKSKASGEVAVMEVGGALLGVRTRSRTLALQQRTSSPLRRADDPPPHQAAGDYLELRSRRLEKQPPPGPKDKEAPLASAAAGWKEQAAAFAAEGFETDLEASFGDNVLDWDAMERCLMHFQLSKLRPLPFAGCCSCSALTARRSTRETTPCSLIRTSETISTPGSATRTSNPSRRGTQTPICRYIPSSLEMEEFFDAAERQQHQAFREKYNFCPANECPLPGRYEWARIDC